MKELEPTVYVVCDHCKIERLLIDKNDTSCYICHRPARIVDKCVDGYDGVNREFQIVKQTHPYGGEEYHLLAYTGNSKKVVVPDYVTHIENRAFSDCTDIEEVFLPQGLKIISKYSFACCSNLQFINIPDSVIYIDEFAFLDCSVLTALMIPDNVRLHLLAFSGCDKLEQFWRKRGLCHYCGAKKKGLFRKYCDRCNIILGK